MSSGQTCDNGLDRYSNHQMVNENGPPLMERSSKRSFLDMTNSSNNGGEMITPPNSTIRKSGPEGFSLNGLRPPLSPALSSPIAARPKKQRIEGNGSGGSLRSNGNFTLQELLESLESRRVNGELAEKPPYSYATLIGLSILQSSLGKLTLSQIYNWISLHFPYYKQKDAGWQNSIRHNLSLNDAFIKAEKSNDGKGHFWQVKPGCEIKFFKGETGSYADIRNKLQDLDRFFDNPLKKKEEEEEEKARGYFGMNSGLASAPVFHRFHKKQISDDEEEEESEKEDDKEDDEEEGEEDEGDEDDEHRSVDGPQIGNDEYYNNPLLHIHSSPGAAPLHLKDLHTRDSFPDDNDDDDDKPHEFGSNRRYANTIFSPQDFKKYSCSFNSSFEEISPRPNRVIDEPFFDSNDFTTNEEHQLRQSPLENIPQMDLLKTPRASNGPNYERTPMRFITSPRDGCDASIRRWQTPSHLFEDLYCSPLFKGICTPIKDGLPSMSPRNISAPDIMSSTRRSRISSSGLFGVDVYAVWKRATESTVSTNSDNSNNQRLDIPFKSIPAFKKDSNTGDMSDNQKS